jgi:hypothetical protein
LSGLLKLVLYCGQPMAVTCDARCDKAWGIEQRPSAPMPDAVNGDDFEWLADDELGTAPEDPGTYEGDDAKPRTPDERMNRWCVRQCERHTFAAMGERVELRDFSRRVPNRNDRVPTR